MANKSVYQDYNLDALIHFGLENEPKYGLCTSYQIDDVLITQEKTIFELIRDKLSDATLTGSTFKNKKRGFILPGHPVSQDRLKAACKEHKITITNDYEKADFLITHDDFYEKFQNGEKIKITRLMYRLWNYEAFPNSESNIAIVNNYSGSVIWDEKLSDRVMTHHLNNAESLMDEWGIPGMAINLAYLIDTGEMDVVDTETLLHSSANKQDLTEELIEEVTQWVDSYDNENIAIAAKIIPTIDYTKNPHLLWQLAQNINGRMHSFNREKDVQYWLEQTELSDLYHMSAQDMILKLEKEEKLDSISFKYLEPIVRKEISIDNRDLYVFKVNVKSEYKKYLK